MKISRIYKLFILPAIGTLMLVQQTASSPECRYSEITIRNGSSTRCLECEKCPLGKGLSHECASYVDSGVEIGCVPCVESKTFSDKDDISSCEPCTLCGENEVTLRTCTVTRNAQCGKCKHGLYRDQSRGCSRCSPCCANSTIDDVVRECREQGMPADHSCRVRAQECAVLEIPSARLTSNNTTHGTGIKGNGPRKIPGIIAPAKATNDWLYYSVTAAIVFWVTLLFGLCRCANKDDYNWSSKYTPEARLTTEEATEPPCGIEEMGSVHSVAYPMAPLSYNRQFVTTDQKRKSI